ncbi:MAG: hypothetical protein KJ574_01270 [Nanoarchaeota archaeon]|nr:hypothetical protein [Nanoarchaeota archaeon]
MENTQERSASVQRQTAFQVSISELLKGSYVKEGGWQPNYIDTGSKKVSRANIIGIVIAIIEESSFKNILIDDNTGRISLRLFENNPVEVSIGDVVMVVGRPRDFGGERYVVPEIIRKIDQKWFEVRKLEMKTCAADPIAVPVDKGSIDSSEEEVEEVIETSPVERLISLIKKIDSGGGALLDDVARESGLKNCEEYINKLLELGEIFEVKPGRFKVLE